MTSTIAADTQIMRGINAAAVLALLREHDALSVSELAATTGLSRQAVTRSLLGLETAGITEFSAPDPNSPRSGRPAQLARFRAEAGHFFAAAVNTREIRLAIADLRGSVVARRTVALGTESALVVLTRATEELLASAGLTPENIWAGAAAAPGIVDHTTGYIRLIPSMEELRGDALATCLRHVLKRDVYLDNDVKLATEGERWKAPRELSSLVLIEWGERVGAGVVLNGQLHRGASNDAGDIGFLDVAVDVEAVTHRPGLGPFENWVGGDEIVALTRAVAVGNDDTELIALLDQTPDSDVLEAIIAEVTRAQPSALQALREISRRLVSGIAAVRALLDPELVIIGGPMAGCGNVLLELMEAHLSAQVLNQPVLELSALGGDAVLFGAIHHALSDIERKHFSAQILTETLSAQSRS